MTESEAINSTLDAKRELFRHLVATVAYRGGLAIQSHVVFTAGVGANSKVPDAAKQLIKFLTGPLAIPVIRTQGMEPMPSPQQAVDPSFIAQKGALR